MLGSNQFPRISFKLGGIFVCREIDEMSAFKIYVKALQFSFFSQKYLAFPNK